MTNLDASKSITKLAKHNFEQSSVGGGTVRWIVDDCLKFLQREIKRNSISGEKYDGLIFDPPAFGRDADGNMWRIDHDLPQVFEMLPDLLSDDPLFVLISCHDAKWPERRLTQSLKSSLSHLSDKGAFSSAFLSTSVDNSRTKDNSLPLGNIARWVRSSA